MGWGEVAFGGILLEIFGVYHNIISKPKTLLETTKHQNFSINLETLQSQHDFHSKSIPKNQNLIDMWIRNLE
jgi:hypothetical protein